MKMLLAATNANNAAHQVLCHRYSSQPNQFLQQIHILPLSISKHSGHSGRRPLSTFQKCQQLISELIKCVDSQPEFVKCQESVRRQYDRDEGHFPPIAPDLVVLPDSTQQVAAVVRLANQHSIPVVPFGTGTGLEGGVLALKGGICLDLRRMDRVREVNEVDFDCTVEPGVTKEALNRHLKDTGLWFTVDPGADASICGMVSTQASGTTSIRYGTMKGNVKNLEVVLPDGRVLHTRGQGRRPWKSSAGYNLTELFIGSEGTLGVVTAATVQLNARPPSVGVSLAGFPSVRDAMESVLAIRQMAIPVARLEFLDDHQMEACLALSPDLHIVMAPTYTLFVEFHGGTKAEVERQSELVEELCQANNAQNFQRSQQQEGIQRLLKARHNSYYATLAKRPGARGFITDVCVPLSALPGVLEQSREMMDRSGLYGTIAGHVGEGNFHCIFPVFEADAKEMATVWELSAAIVKLALSVGGTCTGEHGIGMGKLGYLREEIGEVGWQLMRALKHQLDPKGIMNPGKVFATEHNNMNGNGDGEV